MLGVWARKAPTNPLQNVTGNGDDFIAIFDDIKKQAGTGWNVNTGKYTCAESGIWLLTGSLNFGNLTDDHQNISIWLRSGFVEPFIFTGDAAALRTKGTPPRGGGGDLISVPVSLEVPVDITLYPWFEIVTRISGGNKQVAWVYDSYISIRKVAELP